MPTNNIAQGEIVVVDNLSDRVVSEHNDLIRSTANMNMLSIKLFEIAVSAVNPQTETPSPTVRISKDQMFKALDVHGVNRNTQLTRALTNLRKNADFSFTTYDEKGCPIDKGISPIRYTINRHGKSYVEITFDDEIMPLITQLKKNFTRYQLNDLLQMDSKYSAAIYRWIVMNYRQYEYYANHSNRTQQQLDAYKDPTISLKELRKLTGTEKKYRQFRDFDKRVLQQATEEISANSIYQVSYEKVKNGRRIDAVKFTVEKKSEFEKQLENLEKDGKVTYQDALANKYTASLTVALLLKPTDIANQELIVDLAKNLYPEYDAFVAKYGEDKLKQHLSYVQGHIANQPADLKQYLLAALKNYNPEETTGEQQKPKRRYSRKQRKQVVEQMPAWTRMSEEQMNKKASPEEIKALKDRIKARHQQDEQGDAQATGLNSYL